jgi:hypothetical protein
LKYQPEITGEAFNERSYGNLIEYDLHEKADISDYCDRQ